MYLNFNVTNKMIEACACCFEEIRLRMIEHKPVMNDSETGFIVIIPIVDSITIGEFYCRTQLAISSSFFF